MTEHTPGPWELWVDKTGAFTISHGSLVICSRNPIPHRAAESIGNAYIIGAAKDTLAALKKCVSVFERLADAGNYPSPLLNNGGWQFATDAIRKAEPPALQQGMANKESLES